MKSIYIFCLATLLSCNSKRNDQQQNNIPETLQGNKKSSVAIFSKRGFDDLVDDLYSEKLEKDQVLKKIDRELKELRENLDDSISDFSNFKEKNNNYYSSANQHLGNIHDSTLNNEIRLILTNSKNRFTQKISYLSSLEKLLNEQENTATDKYAVIKILITLGMMESYQDAAPLAKPIESVLNKFKSINKEMDSIINKNK